MLPLCLSPGYASFSSRCSNAVCVDANVAAETRLTNASVKPFDISLLVCLHHGASFSISLKVSLPSFHVWDELRVDGKSESLRA